MIWQTHTTTITTSPYGIAHRMAQHEGQIKKPLMVIDKDKIQKDQLKNYIHIQLLLFVRTQSKLQSMQVNAQMEEKPDCPSRTNIRTSKLDEAYLLKDNTENVIRAKFDRIGYAS